MAVGIKHQHGFGRYIPGEQSSSLLLEDVAQARTIPGMKLPSFLILLTSPEGSQKSSFPDSSRYVLHAEFVEEVHD